MRNVKTLAVAVFLSLLVFQSASAQGVSISLDSKSCFIYGVNSAGELDLSLGGHGTFHGEKKLICRAKVQNESGKPFNAIITAGVGGSNLPHKMTSIGRLIIAPSGRAVFIGSPPE